MQVKDYMTPAPTTIRSDADYQEAFEVLAKGNLHHLPVADESGQLVGILSRRDLDLAARYFQDHPTEIGEVMHTPVMTISPNADLIAAVEMMTKGYIRCLPVSEDGGKHLVGIITETDLMRALHDLLAQTGS